MTKNLIYLISLVLILSGCASLPRLPNKNITPAIIAWGGMYEIAVTSGKNNKTSYYHKAYSKETNKVVKGIFKKMRAYFISPEFKFSEFQSQQVISKMRQRNWDWIFMRMKLIRSSFIP